MVALNIFLNVVLISTTDWIRSADSRSVVVHVEMRRFGLFVLVDRVLQIDCLRSLLNWNGHMNILEYSLNESLTSMRFTCTQLPFPFPAGL